MAEDISNLGYHELLDKHYQISSRRQFWEDSLPTTVAVLTFGVVYPAIFITAYCLSPEEDRKDIPGAVQLGFFVFGLGAMGAYKVTEGLGKVVNYLLDKKDKGLEEKLNARLLETRLKTK